MIPPFPPANAAPPAAVLPAGTCRNRAALVVVRHVSAAIILKRVTVQPK